MIKSMATFTTFKPDFHNVYSAIYAQYIVEAMEKSFRDSQKAFWEFFNPFKDDEFWYAFLEQSVQTYGRLVDDGTIIDPPEAVLQALIRINDEQEKYKYPNRTDLKEAKEVDETSFFQTLKGYRAEKAFEFVQATEEDAKIVLKEMVIVELQTVGDILSKNLDDIGMSPKYTDLAYYLFSNMCQGANDLDLDTLDLLTEMLSKFKGTLLIVSHDRDFLDQTVNKILTDSAEYEKSLAINQEVM